MIMDKPKNVVKGVLLGGKCFGKGLYEGVIGRNYYYFFFQLKWKIFFQLN